MTSWECDHCGEIHVEPRECCQCLGYLSDTEGGYCICPAAVAKSDEAIEYWQRELTGTTARDVFNERYLAESGIDPDEVLRG